MSDGDDLNKKLRELIARFRAGDHSSANEIARLLERPMMLYLRHHVRPELIQEVYQETWRRFFEHMKDVDRDIQQPTGWFSGIARYVRLELNDPRNKPQGISPELLDLNPAPNPSAERHAEAEQLRRRLEECLERIKPRYKRILLGNAYNEDRASICLATNTKPERFHMMLHRARELLKECMGGVVSIPDLD